MNSAVQIDGFQSFPVVRQKDTGGGLYIGIRHGLCESVLSEYGKNAEFVTVRMNCKGQGLRFILVYGPQEKELEENRTEFYETLSIEIEKCFLSGDSLVLAGTSMLNLVMILLRMTYMSCLLMASYYMH